MRSAPRGAHSLLLPRGATRPPNPRGIFKQGNYKLGAAPEAPLCPRTETTQRHRYGRNLQAKIRHTATHGGLAKRFDLDRLVSAVAPPERQLGTCCHRRSDFPSPRFHPLLASVATMIHAATVLGRVKAAAARPRKRALGLDPPCDSVAARKRRDGKPVPDDRRALAARRRTGSTDFCLSILGLWYRRARPSLSCAGLRPNAAQPSAALPQPRANTNSMDG